MVAVNRSRIWLGALAGGVVWNAWSMLVHTVILGPRYVQAQEAGQLLPQPRYGLFLPIWILALFVLSWGIAMLYAATRATCGAGFKTAVWIGTMVGFAAGFPINFSLTAWAPFDRHLPLWWTLDMWVGAMLAAIVAGWLYRDNGRAAAV